jgi:hypothetical protein
MVGLIVLLVLAGIVTGGLWAIKHLPWWSLLAGVVALFLVGKWVLQHAFVSLLTVPFKMKGAVLRGAGAEVHSVVPTTAPDAEESSDATRRHYWVDVTVRPTGQSQGFQCWEPGELQLVRPESHLNPHDSNADEGTGVCDVMRLEVEQDGAFQADEGWKLAGPQRLRLLLAVEPGVSALKFRYYFEEFGQVRLPAESVSGLRSTG